jgi:hypothetical protein
MTYYNNDNNCIHVYIVCVCRQIGTVLLLLMFISNIIKIKFNTDLNLNYSVRAFALDCLHPFFMKKKNQMITKNNIASLILQLATLLTQKSNTRMEAFIHVDDSDQSRINSEKLLMIIQPMSIYALY